MIRREEFGFCGASKSAANNAKDCVLFVRVIVPGRFIGTEAINATPIRKAPAKKASNAFDAGRAG